MDDRQNITIRFGTYDIPMTVRRKDEHLYRKAEELMKQRHAFYTNTYAGQRPDQYLVLTMLDIAVQLQTALESNTGNESLVLERLTPLLKEIEDKLAK